MAPDGAAAHAVAAGGDVRAVRDGDLGSTLAAAVHLADTVVDLDDRLGKGGFATVYRGHHARLGLPVAVKILEDGAVARDPAFDVELRAIAALTHPGIVRVLHHGRVPPGTPLPEGARYLVMELVDGVPLREWRPAGWDQVRDAWLGILDALAHAHARGVVHGDIGPNNVLITRGGATRLVDFGLARGLVAATSSKRVAGTPGYMAPEQRAGRFDEVGPWTDLFALGAVAWAMLTGAPPATSPPPPLGGSWPEGTEGWLLRLLARRPELRYRRCADAARDLVALDAGDVPTGVAPVLAATVALTEADDDPTEAVGSDPEPVFLPRPPCPPSWRGAATTPDAARHLLRTAGTSPTLLGLLELPLVGRLAERDRLWEALREVHRTGRPGLVVVHGPAGVGKSRLGRWLVERAHELGVADVARALPPVAELERLAEHRVAVALLDDAEEAHVELAAEALARAAPILVVLTVRDESLAEHPLARERLAGLPARWIAVGPLDARDHGLLVRSLLDLEPALAAEIEDRTQGNPMFAVQLLGSLLERAALEPGPRGLILAGDATLPPDLGRVWRDRVARVLHAASGSRAALELAATLGSTVRAAEWGRACDLARADASPALVDALVEAQLWHPVAGGWRFASALLAEAIRADAGARLADHHRVCARALAAEGPDVLERRALHLDGAGDPEAWLALGAAAGDRGRRSEYRRSAWLSRRQIRVLEGVDPDRTDPRWARTLRLYGETLTLLGDEDEALRVLNDAVSRARDLDWPDLPVLLRTLADAHVSLDHYREAAALYDEIAASNTDLTTIGLALVGLANVAQAKGDLYAAIASYRRAVDVLEPADLRAGATLGLAACLVFQGRRDEATPCLATAHDLADRSGAAHLGAMATHLVGYAAIEAGDVPGGEACVHEAIAILEPIGNPIWLGFCRRTLARAAALDGRLAWAESELTALIPFFDTCDPSEADLCRVQLGHLRLEAGADPAAVAHEVLARRPRLDIPRLGARLLRADTQAVGELRRDVERTGLRDRILARVAELRGWADLRELLDVAAYQEAPYGPP